MARGASASSRSSSRSTVAGIRTRTPSPRSTSPHEEDDVEEDETEDDDNDGLVDSVTSMALVTVPSKKSTKKSSKKMATSEEDNIDF